MIINDIKYDEKKDLFQVEISDDIFLLEYKDLEKFELSSGKKINNKLFTEISDLDSYVRAKNKIFKYVTSGLKTSKSVIDKLYRSGFNKKTIEMVIDFYSQLGFINDRYFAKQYSKTMVYNKCESIRKTKYKLLEKGISSDIVNDIIDSIPSEVDLDNLRYQFNKKYKKENLDIKEKQKAIRFLQYKGFSYNDIKRIIEIEF